MTRPRFSCLPATLAMYGIGLALLIGLPAQAVTAPAGATLIDRCEVSLGDPNAPPGGPRGRKTGRIILTMQGSVPTGSKLRLVAANGSVMIIPFASSGDTPALSYPVRATLLSSTGKVVKTRLNGKRFVFAKGYHVKLAFTVDEMNGAKCRTLVAPPDPREFPRGAGKVRPSMRPYYGVDEFGKPMIE